VIERDFNTEELMLNREGQVNADMIAEHARSVAEQRKK
jgi:hypothetical protein